MNRSFGIRVLRNAVPLALLCFFTGNPVTATTPPISPDNSYWQELEAYAQTKRQQLYNLKPNEQTCLYSRACSSPDPMRQPISRTDRQYPSLKKEASLQTHANYPPAVYTPSPYFGQRYFPHASFFSGYSAYHPGVLY